MRLGKQHFIYSLAILGLLITIAGNFFDISITKKLCYLIGALILLITALLEKNKFFSILEIILSIGAAIAFTDLSFFWKSSIPVSLGILAAIYLGVSGQLKDYLTWLSVFGVLLAAWGYAVTNPIIYLCAGAILATYSFCSFGRGERIALAFGALNSVFAVTAFLEIVKVI